MNSHLIKSPFTLVYIQNACYRLFNADIFVALIITRGRLDSDKVLERSNRRSKDLAAPKQFDDAPLNWGNLWCRMNHHLIILLNYERHTAHPTFFSLLYKQQ